MIRVVLSHDEEVKRKIWIETMEDDPTENTNTDATELGGETAILTTIQEVRKDMTTEMQELRGDITKQLSDLQNNFQTDIKKRL